MLLEMVREFKEKINKGPVFGVFSKTSDPAFIECLGYAGFDYVIIDMEHAPHHLSNMQNLIRAAQIAKIVPIVRIIENSYHLINQVLDIGAAGVQIPHVKCKEDIKEILEHAKFFPKGNRGMCRYVRAAKYSSIKGEEYFKRANENLIIIQIEGKEGYKNIDSIIEHGGFDILFIGPYDLSQSLGVPGNIEHPLVLESVNKIVKKCNEKRIIVGNFNDSMPMAKMWIKKGIRYISYSVDVGLFYDASKKLAQSLKEI